MPGVPFVLVSLNQGSNDRAIEKSNRDATIYQRDARFEIEMSVPGQVITFAKQPHFPIRAVGA